jgi:hypothetical protein
MKTLQKVILSLGLVCLTLLATSSEAAARNIPANALKASMSVVSGRVLNLNNKQYLMAPGCLIYNTENLIVQTQSLSSGTYFVRVIVDTQNEVRKVWILTDSEARDPAHWLGGDSLWSKILP